jgi:putative mycofactocin binding protein MftB
VLAPIDSGLLDRQMALHPRVALRPEPFGALAYHYGNRKLVFLKHPDVVRVVRALDGHATLADTLRACGIDEARWPSFQQALASLTESEMLHEPTK